MVVDNLLIRPYFLGEVAYPWDPCLDWSFFRGFRIGKGRMLVFCDYLCIPQLRSGNESPQSMLDFWLANSTWWGWLMGVDGWFQWMDDGWWVRFVYVSARQSNVWLEILKNPSWEKRQLPFDVLRKDREKVFFFKIPSCRHVCIADATRSLRTGLGNVHQIVFRVPPANRARRSERCWSWMGFPSKCRNPICEVFTCSWAAHST